MSLKGLQAEDRRLINFSHFVESVEIVQKFFENINSWEVYESLVMIDELTCGEKNQNRV